MIALTYFETGLAVLVIACVGAAAGVFAIAICGASASSCTGDCNQGRNCTCRGASDA